jgi:FlaA1/EpsC-like NDP-sugar epimerase
VKELKSYYKGKSVLVTGGAGSIGSEIVKKLLEFDPKVIRVLDINETGVFDLEQELHSEKLRPLIGDIRDKDRIRKAMENIDIVFHAAALKHVPLCEYNPFEAVKTNVVGTQNVLDAAINEGVGKFITISTDKAVNPTNVMGATKLLAERLTISANSYKGRRETVFSCVRFGNVLDSRGSVIPLFRKQIENGKPITVTNPEMTRFVMSIPKAVELILHVGKITRGEEIFILKMPSLRISHLAEAVIEEVGPVYGRKPGEITIKTIGRRAGEKIFEELMREDEAENAYENDDMFVILQKPLGAIDELNRDLLSKFKKAQMKKYSSNEQKLLTKDEIKQLLREVMKL